MCFACRGNSGVWEGGGDEFLTASGVEQTNLENGWIFLCCGAGRQALGAVSRKGLLDCCFRTVPPPGNH